MNRRKVETVREILQHLLDSKKSFGNYTQTDIQNAIQNVRDCVDKRTVDQWFSYLWRKQYFLQPQPGAYSINIEKIADLEVKIPIEIDPQQKRLGEFGK